MAVHRASYGIWAQALSGFDVTDFRKAYECSRDANETIAAKLENFTIQCLLAWREIGRQLHRNSNTNIHAILDLAEGYAQARSMSDIGELQRRFLEDHTERLVSQMSEFETLVTAEIRSFLDEAVRVQRA